MPVSPPLAGATERPTTLRSRLPRLLADLVGYRHRRGMNQTEFWALYGATQSAGSRYETGRGIPRPMMVLFALEEMGAIDAELLERACVRVDRALRQQQGIAG